MPTSCAAVSPGWPWSASGATASIPAMPRKGVLRRAGAGVCLPRSSLRRQTGDGGPAPGRPCPGGRPGAFRTHPHSPPFSRRWHGSAQSRLRPEQLHPCGDLRRGGNRLPAARPDGKALKRGKPPPAAKRQAGASPFSLISPASVPPEASVCVSAAWPGAGLSAPCAPLPPPGLLPP